jgi:hypothetical protein
MKFTQSQIQAFEDFSYDRNPLHIDADYARRSQFGKPVVYGMAGVLAVLGEWKNKKPFQFESLLVQFEKPTIPWCGVSGQNPRRKKRSCSDPKRSYSVHEPRVQLDGVT